MNSVIDWWCRKRIGRRGNEATAGIANPMDKSAALRTLGKFAEPPVKVNPSLCKSYLITFARVCQPFNDKFHDKFDD